MTTLLRASDSAQFLSMVPSLMGFTPRQSVALLPFRGSRAEGAMRIDLPDDAVPLDEYAAAAVGLLARVQDADGVALVVYAEDDPDDTRDGLVLPHAVAIEALLCCAADAGLRIVDALCIAPSGWASYLEVEPELHPLDTIAAAPPAASGDVSGDQFAGTALPPADLAEKESVGQALRDLSALFDDARKGRPTGNEDPRMLAALVLLEDVPAFFESVLTAPELPPFATATLLWCLGRPLLRDTAITQWATNHAGGLSALEAQIEFATAGQGVPDDVGRVFLGQGKTPEGDRLRHALSVVREAAARAPRSARTAPLTVAAWLSWALGRATHAGRYLEMAREIDPEYGLAAMLETMIDRAILPEWAFRRRAA